MNEARPLSGRRVLLTRAAEQAAATKADLEARGAQVAVVPLLAFAAPSSWKPLDDALASIEKYDGVVITSKNALSPLFERGVSLPARLRFWAVGPASAKALEERGRRVVAIPDDFRGDALGPLVAGARRVLLPRAEEGREEVVESLRAAGVEVDLVAAYRTICPPDAARALRKELETALDAIVLTSPSAASHLVESGVPLPPRAVIAAIGPVTAARCVALGIPPRVVSSRHTSADLVEALEDHFRRNPGR